jgi:hypothetical protein
VVETLTPVDVKEPVPGVYVFDAGQNLAGWAALKVQDLAGAKVTLRFAETLEDNGCINQRNLRFGKAEDTYISYIPSSFTDFVPAGCVALPLFAPIQPAFSTELLPE